VVRARARARRGAVVVRSRPLRARRSDGQPYTTRPTGARLPQKVRAQGDPLQSAVASALAAPDGMGTSVGGCVRAHVLPPPSAESVACTAQQLIGWVAARQPTATPVSRAVDVPGAPPADRCWSVVECGGDGDCLFCVVAWALGGSVRGLRTYVAAAVTEHECKCYVTTGESDVAGTEDLRATVAAARAGTEALRQHVLTSAYWADAFAVATLAKALGVVFVVLEREAGKPDRVSAVIAPSQPDNGVLVVVHHGAHYLGVALPDGRAAFFKRADALPEWLAEAAAAAAGPSVAAACGLVTARRAYEMALAARDECSDRLEHCERRASLPTYQKVCPEACSACHPLPEHRRPSEAESALGLQDPVAGNGRATPGLGSGGPLLQAKCAGQLRREVLTQRVALALALKDAEKRVAERRAELVARDGAEAAAAAETSVREKAQERVRAAAVAARAEQKAARKRKAKEEREREERKAQEERRRKRRERTLKRKRKRTRKRKPKPKPKPKPEQAADDEDDLMESSFYQDMEEEEEGAPKKRPRGWAL
jgi:hypothetical protein